MQLLIIIAGLVVASLAQWLNTKPQVPSKFVKLSLVLVGIAFYLPVAVPAAWWGPPMLEWLDKAWIWGLALPGAASLIGTVPGMKTNDRGNT